MSEDMLGEALRQIAGPLKDLLDKLSGAEGSEWVEALKKFLRKENPWPQVQKAAPDLLQLITTVTIPAIKTFSPEGRFQVGERDGVKIGWVGDNAKRLMRGMVEEAVEQTTLRIHTLKEPSSDGPIIAELGGEEVITTTWGQMYEMMRRQGHGQEGNLLTNGYANIFYIKCSDGIWAVCCRWRSRYADWRVGANPVTFPLRWGAGCQVASR